MRRAIILFTRVPEAGKTKTRLSPYLTPEQCAKLHTCFLKDIIGECQNCEADVFVSFTPFEGRLKLQQILGEQKRYFPQEGEGLGERMYRAIEYVLEQGYSSCLLMGTDIPEVRREDLLCAFDVLEEKDIVFGKTRDGGYYLVGMKRPVKEVFSLDSYGHSRVLEETIEELRRKKMTVGYTAEMFDMDIKEDLQGYRRRMRKNPRLKQTCTGEYLAANTKISVIVPTYNEAKTIESLQQQLKPYSGKCEIIFVDGGSTDGTAEKIDSCFRVIKTGKGRAGQMNAGAQASTGDVLFFLHCDSELPPRFPARIRKVMRDHPAGCFGIAFHSFNFFMFTCRVISNHRIKDRKVMFGDQGIFVERELFFEAGMFPDMPIMEDYQFSLTLKEMGVKLGMADRRIYTSGRRFPKGTVPKLKLMWKMNRLRKMYRDGIPAEKLAKLYPDIR